MHFKKNWHRARLSFPDLTGKGVTIAVLDGCFCPHSAFQTTDKRKVWLVDGTADRWKPHDFQECAKTMRPAHGLIVASIAASAGLFPGVAPDANLLLVKGACKPDRGKRHIMGDHQAYANLVRWITKRKKRFNIRILVLTVCPSCIDNLAPMQQCPLALVVEEASEKGILVVCAAANTPFVSPPSPAIAPSVLTVGPLTGGWKGILSWKLAKHCFGITLDGKRLPEIFAPGDAPVPRPPQVSINNYKFNFDGSRVPKELLKMRYTYAPIGATSLAAPFVAGVAALCLETNPKLAPYELKHIIIKSATRLPHIPEEKQGAGLINPLRAVQLAKHYCHRYRKPVPKVKLTGKKQLVKKLQSRKKEERESALNYLWSLPKITRGMAEALIPALALPYPKVVCSVLSFLSGFKTFRDRIYQSGLATHSSPHIRTAWARAIATKDDEKLHKAVIRLLQDPHQDVRFMGASLAKLSKNTALLPYLIKAMGEIGNWPLFSSARIASERIAGVAFSCKVKRDERWNERFQRCVFNKWKRWLAKTKSI